MTPYLQNKNNPKILELSTPSANVKYIYMSNEPVIITPAKEQSFE